MLNSQILEVAIGLVFVYLLFSMICSGFNEWFARVFLKLRSSTLLEGIYSLINDPGIIYNLYRHPLINALANQPPQPEVERHNLEHLSIESLKERLQLKKQPSYIPGRTFALALIDQVAPAQQGAGTHAQTLPEIRDTITRLPNDQYEWIKQALLPLLDAAPDLEHAYKNVEKWFNDAMDRVSGWYKRKTKWITIFLAVIVCAGMNVDTFTIANSLYRDEALRKAVVAAAEKEVKKTTTGEEKTSGKAAETKPPTATTAPRTSTGPVTSPAPPAPKTGTPPIAAAAKTETHPSGDKTAQNEKGKKEDNLAGAITEVEKLHLPLGWVREPQDPRSITVLYFWQTGAFPGFLLKVLGLFFSILAVSLGAPFWFDLLNKLVNLRGTGNKPATAAAKSKP